MRDRLVWAGISVLLVIGLVVFITSIVKALGG